MTDAPRKVDSEAGESLWELLDRLEIVDFLILEQLYLVESGPMPLRRLHVRLGHANVHRRTISRHALRLSQRGLLSAVSSGDLFLNPLPRLTPAVTRLLNLWQARERNARRPLRPPSGPG